MEIGKITPNISSLIESLRDIGYSFETAVADIIDNSITAQAKNINIYFEIEKDDLKIAIIDDGVGMNSEELFNAMKLGSQNPLSQREQDDLGRFGLGLKTASFSQCRRLTVVSQNVGLRWDLDFISETNDWNIQILNNNEIQKLYKIEEYSNCKGTFVLWEKTDRIHEGIFVDNRELIFNKMEYLEKHLELVFHRYLREKEEKEKKEEKLKIFINGHELYSFDPFNKKHSATQELSKEEINGIVIKPYILPHYSKVSSEIYDYYGGEGGYIKNQGFYVYRNKRLLISGTWFRLIPKSDAYKLARIQIDLPNNLDSQWKIDIKKSTAFPPEMVRKRLKTLIEKISNCSKRVYTSRGTRIIRTEHSFWERFALKGKIDYKINKNHPIIMNFINDLNENQKKEFDEILKCIELFFPINFLYSDIITNPKDLEKSSIDDVDLEQQAINYYNVFLKKNISFDKIGNHLKNTEPFNIYSKNWQLFFNNLLTEGKI